MSRGRALKSLSLLWLGSILGAGCAFLTQVLLARELGPASFGVFAAALAIVVLVAPLASFGVAGFWLKAFGKEGWQGIHCLRGSFKYTVLTTVFVMTSLFAWASLGPHEAATRSLLAVLTALLLGQVAMELVSAKLQLEGRYFALALWQLLPHLARLLSVAILAFLMANLMSLSSVAYAYALTSIVVFLTGTLSLWRMFRGQFALQGHGEPPGDSRRPREPIGMMKVAAQSWPFGLAGVFYLIYFQSDVILLKYLIGNEAAGIYNVAFVIMAAVYMLPSVVYQKFLLPKIHRWANHDHEMFYHVYRIGNKVMLALGLLAMFLIWGVAPYGVSFLFGESYGDAIQPLRILALAAPVRFLATSIGSVLVTQQHMRKKVWLMAVTALTNIVLNLIFIPIFGIEGAALCTVISDMILLALYAYSVRRNVFNNR